MKEGGEARLQHMRGLHRFPDWVLDRFPNVLSRVTEQVRSERALGMVEMDEDAHWDQVHQDFQHGMGV